MRLLPGATGAAHRAPDLSRYSERQVDLAMQRAACVRRLWRARASDHRPQRQWLPQLIEKLRAEHPDLRISRSSLLNWNARYRDPADLVKLIDTRGGNTRGEPDPAAWDLFRSLYLTEHKRKIKWCWKQVRDRARADGMTWCSYPQLLRLVRQRISPAERCKYRNPELYRSKHSDYIDMDPESWGPGELWIGDHCVLDLWCLNHKGVPVRPWLTAWMDWRTRRIVGHTLSLEPNSQTILSAFRAAILDPANNGGPDTVYIDNGRDYAAQTFCGHTKPQRRIILKRGSIDEPAFRGLYGTLGIDVIFATPYNARAKGRLEQWFNYALHEDFDKSFVSYAGNRPENRPTDLTAILKAGDQVPTLDRVRERLARHIRAYNASRDHGKDDMVLDGVRVSPDEMMATGRRRHFADPGVLDRFMLTFSPPVRVRRHRVTISILGTRHVYKSDDPVFADLNGRADEYRVGYDQDDLGVAVLFDERMRPVCQLYEATYGRPSGDHTVSRSHLSEALRRQRKLNRAQKLLAGADLDLVLSTRELALLEAAHAPDPEPPSTRDIQPVKLIQTALDGHAKQCQRWDLKQAAGAETGSSEDIPRGLADLVSFADGLTTTGSGDELDDAPIDFASFCATDEVTHENDQDDDPFTIADLASGGGHGDD